MPNKPAEKASKDPKVQLLEKIFNVQQQVEILQKTNFNEAQKYFFARESDFISTIKPLLGEYKLMVIPTHLKTDVRDTSTSSGSPAESVLVQMVYTIYDTETGESLQVPVSAAGKDSGDKAVAKALTMANKYFLAKTFQMETTTDDPEYDKYNGEQEEPTGKQKTAPKKSEEPRDPAKEFDKAKELIKGIKSKTVAFKVLEGIQSSKLYNDNQKKELSLLLNHKVDEIDNPTA